MCYLCTVLSVLNTPRRSASSTDTSSDAGSSYDDDDDIVIFQVTTGVLAGLLLITVFVAAGMYFRPSSPSKGPSELETPLY